MKFTLAVEVKQSTIHWFWLGLHPGSFGMACILRDYERAVNSAHPMIMEHIRDHMAYADFYLPYQAKDKDWKGFKNISKGEQDKIILTRPIVRELEMEAKVGRYFIEKGWPQAGVYKVVEADKANDCIYIEKATFANDEAVGPIMYTYDGHLEDDETTEDHYIMDCVQ